MFSGPFFLEIRKYKLSEVPRLNILISQKKLPLNAVCFLRMYADKTFSFSLSEAA